MCVCVCRSKVDVFWSFKLYKRIFKLKLNPPYFCQYQTVALLYFDVFTSFKVPPSSGEDPPVKQLLFFSVVFFIYSVIP